MKMNLREKVTNVCRTDEGGEIQKEMESLLNIATSLGGLINDLSISLVSVVKEQDPMEQISEKIELQSDLGKNLAGISTILSKHYYSLNDIINRIRL